jgi:hypothetical protein
MVNSPLRKRRIAGGGETEQIIGPVMNAENAFLVEIAHLAYPAGWRSIVPVSSFVYIHSYTNE